MTETKNSNEMKIQLSSEKPKIYSKLYKKFGVKWDLGVIITYGTSIHCKFLITEAKIAHELVHVRQQTVDMDKDAWWDLYLKDEAFRLKQEVEAYREEVRYIKRTISDRNMRARLIHQICVDLSSKMYGSIVTYQEAQIILGKV